MTALLLAALTLTQPDPLLWQEAKARSYHARMMALGAPDSDHAWDLAWTVARYDDRTAVELLAVSHVETSWRPGVVSHAGACGPWQSLGGRYGNPSCEDLDADPELAAQTAIEELEYWRRKCGKAYLDAYNGGCRKCWTVDSRRACTTECKTYSAKVRRTVRRLKGGT